MSSVEVFHNQSASVFYPDDNVVSTLSTLAAKNIVAFKDQQGSNTDLILGATSNVNVEALDTVNIFTGDGALALYKTTVDDSNVRTDRLLLDVVETTEGVTRIEAGGSNSLVIMPADANKTTVVGDLTIMDDLLASEVVVSTGAMTDGLRLSGNMKVDGYEVVRDYLSVGSDTFIGGNNYVNGSVYSKNYNIWKSATEGVATSNASKVGYAFVLNDRDQLEIVKYVSFSNETNSEIYKKVAVFGTQQLSLDESSDGAYMAFDPLNGVTLMDGNGSSNVVIPGASVSGSTSNLNLYNSTLSGTTTVSGNLIPSANEVYDIGSANSRYRDLYLSGNTLYMANSKIEVQNGAFKFFTGSNERVDVTPDNLYVVNSNFGFFNSNPTYDVDIKGSFRVEDGPVVLPMQSVSHLAIAGLSNSQFSTNNSNVYIMSSNVGFGTSTPGANLDVNGSFRVQNGPVTFPAGSVSHLAIAGLSNSQWSQTQSNLFILSSNVGIGTDAPTARLDVAGDIKSSGSVTVGGDITVTGNLTVNGTTTTIDTQTLLIEDNLVLLNKNQTGTPSSVLLSGIEVERGDSPNYMFVFSEATDSFNVGMSNSLQAVATREDSPSTFGIPSWNNALARFDTSSTFVRSNAFVGIGTATPGQTLDVLGSFRVQNGPVSFPSQSIAATSLSNLTYLNVTGTIPFGSFGSNTIPAFALSNLTASSITFGTNSVPSTAVAGLSNTQFKTNNSNVYITGSNVGIGTTTPSYPLHVSGQSNNISIFATHDVVVFSDKRVKADIQKVENALEKINQISGYTFVRSDDLNPDQRRVAGVIAQEVNEVLPEVVHETNEGYLSVAYGNMAALFIESIKELDAKITKINNQMVV